MAVKGVNFFEQHVEKIVLAVAAAGAVYMGYSAMQKITIDGTSPPVSPNDVEPAIAGKLSEMEHRATQIANNPPKMPQLNYPERFHTLVENEPIDDPQAGVQIVNAPVPSFGPSNFPLAGSYVPPTLGTDKAIGPAPVAPENLTVELWEGMVGDALAAGAVAPVASGGSLTASAPPPPAAAGGVGGGQTHDQSAALIQGFVPVGKLLVQMDETVAKDPRNNNHQNIYPATYRDAEIYRIRVQRRERTATGWSDYKEVSPTKAVNPPEINIDWPSQESSDIPRALESAAANFKQIVIPDFYPDASGVPVQPTILKAPVPKNITKETDDLHQKLQSLQVAAPAAGGGGGGSLTVGAVGPAGAGALPLAGALPTDPTQLHAMEVVPFAFWDETVDPNHTYQYQVKVEFVNPLYKWTRGLANPNDGADPLLSTGWVNIATPVTVNSDMAFFISGSGFAAAGAGVSPEISSWVFKKNNGKWYRNQFTTSMGAPISGSIELVDRPGVPKMDVDTGYSVVDVVQDTGNVHVVLKGPDGTLVTRDSAADRADPNYNELADRSVKLVAATTTAPANGSPAGGSLSLTHSGTQTLTHSGSLTTSGGGSLTGGHTATRPTSTRPGSH